VGETTVVTSVLLPLALALIMGSLGLSLTIGDFRRIFEAPRGVIIGLANLFVVSPLLAFAIAKLFGLDPVFAVGLVLLGASPGGTTSNVITHFARGETALSVTMTAISSIAAVVTVPLYLGLAIAHFDAPVGEDLSMLGIVARVFAITIVPLSIGMWLRARDPERIAALEPRAKRLALVLFVLVVVGAIAQEFDTFTENVGQLAAATLTLNILGMAISFTAARLARLDDRQATAIALELGVHNATLAIAVGAVIDERLAIPAAVYSAFMFLTAGLFAKVMHGRNVAETETETVGPGPGMVPVTRPAEGAP
jgi:bile acid:Na+ symporter, BASS family